ncbi:MAG: NUDIX hydrolase [Microthrixaceae bacterium]
MTAARELREEVGLEATELIPLVELLHSPGFCDEVNHIFLATGLTGVERSVDGPEEEHMTIVHLPLADLYDRIADGTLTDAKTIVGLTLAYHRLIG